MGKQTKKCSGSRPRHHYGVGIDVHKHYVTACVAVLRGGTVRKVALQEFKQSPKGLAEMCQFLGKYLLEVVVMEATGVYTPTVKDALEAFKGWSFCHPAIIVINPSLVRKYPGEPHYDKGDAQDLARIGLLGLAEGSFIPAGTARELRALTREVDVHERDCARAKNRIKRVLDAAGIRLEDLDLSNAWPLDLFRALDWAGGRFGDALSAIGDGSFPVPSRSRTAIRNRAEAYMAYKDVALVPTSLLLLRGHLAVLAFNGVLIGKIGQEIEVVAGQEPSLQAAIARIAIIAGLSSEAAASIVAEVGDIRRFPTVKGFLMYAGCASALYKSGKVEIAGHLSKRVNMYLKRKFFLAGKAICVNVKENSDLKEYARAQMNRHWAKKERKLAFMNTGIKLAKLIYAIMKGGRAYDPEYASKKRKDVPVPGDGLERGISPQDGDNPASITSVPPVVLRNLRKRARQFARYIKYVCGGTHAEWYGTLAKYFNLLEQNGAILP